MLSSNLMRVQCSVAVSSLAYLEMILEYSLPQAPRHSALPGGTWLKMCTFSPAASAARSCSISQTSMLPVMMDGIKRMA